MRGQPGLGSSSEAHSPPILGLIALDRDVVIESDLHRLTEPLAKVVTTRIPLHRVGSLTHLKKLDTYIPGATEILRASSPSVVAFGCTSGVAAMGAEHVHTKISEIIGDVPSVDPLSGMAEGLARLGVERVAVVTPYGPTISETLSSWFEETGFTVAADVEIQRGDARHYAEIPPSSVVDAVERAAKRGADGVVIACTDLRAIDLIDGLEEQIGMPIITSNQALAWAASEVVGLNLTGTGTLFALDPMSA